MSGIERLALSTRAGLDARFRIAGTSEYPAIEGIKITGDGHSYATGAGASNTFGWLQRVTYGRLGMYGQSFIVSRAQSGNHMEDLAARAWNGSLGGTALTYPTTGLVIIDCNINNLRNGGSGAKALLSFKHALRMALLMYRGASKIEESVGANFTFSSSPAWSSNSNSRFSASTAQSTRSVNAYVDVTFPAQTVDPVAVIATGVDTVIGDRGADWTVTEGGTTITTGTGDDAFLATANASTVGKGVLPIVIPATGVTTGNRTVRITKTDTRSGEMNIDGLLLPSATKPTILVLKDPAVSDWGTNGSDAGRLLYNAAIDSVVAEFPSDGSLLSLDLNAGWDTAVHISSDGLHPGDRGHNQLATLIGSYIANLPFRSGQNVL